MSAQTLATHTTLSNRPPGLYRPASFPSPSDDSFADLFGLVSAQITFDRNAEVFGEGEGAEFLYQVKSGCIRAYKVLGDGRRQIGAFYLPGDIFGIEAGKEHSFSAEAISPSSVKIVRRSIVNSRASGNSTLAHELLSLTVNELHRAQAHTFLLVKSAKARVAGFLLEMASRAKSRGEVILPMSRQDIADYLGLTIETVSRTMTQLEDTAMIALPTSRRIVLLNQPALARLND